MKTPSQTLTFSTTAYDMFKFFPENRDVTHPRFERIKNAILASGYIMSFPLLVTRDYYVIDGQGRLAVCKHLGIPVPYVFFEGTRQQALELMVTLNITGGKWIMDDYIWFHSVKGVRCHKLLLDFVDTHKLGTYNSIHICFDAGDENITTKLKKGVDVPLLSRRDEIAKFILSCSDLSYYKSINFVRSVCFLFRKGKEDDINKILKKHLAIPQQASASAYLSVFENIINKGKNGKKRISLM